MMKERLLLALLVIGIVGLVTACQTHDEAIHQDALNESKMIYGE